MSLDIETLAVLFGHASENDTARPMANLNSAAHGPEALAELRLYLESFLGSASAEVCAQFSSPSEIDLRFTSVELPHDATPKRFRLPPAVTISSLVLGESGSSGVRGRWVVVLPLTHTFWVPVGEDLDEAIASETERMVRAKRDDPWDYLRHLPAAETCISRLKVPVLASSSEAQSKRKQKSRELEAAQKKKTAILTLESVATPWHEGRLKSVPPPYVQVGTSKNTLAPLLEGRERSSVLLVGEELAGKTALLESWFHDAHSRGKSRPIYQTSAARLVAGMSGLGQWQARMERVLLALEVLDAVLYFENLVELFGDRANSSVDLAGAIKPFLDEDRIRIVAEVSQSALQVLAPTHAGFFGSLTEVRVEAGTSDDSVRVLAARDAFTKEHEPDRPRFSESARTTIVSLANRYLPYQPHPGKAAQLYDAIRASFEKDPSLQVESTTINSTDVEKFFSLRTGIPTLLLRESRPLQVSTVEAQLRRRVVGQAEAVSTLAETVAVMKAGLSPTDKPLGVFLFVGPTGVGKTELARALADFVFASESRMVRFDMSEYADPSAALRLIRGTEQHDGLLTQAIRREPFSILLLDEIEKAHPSVFDMLLGALGEARITDYRGRTAFLHNTIVIMTSNVGTRGTARRIGIGAVSSSPLERYLQAARKHFRPEFLNRLDRVVPFGSLGQDEVRAIARIIIRQLGIRRGLSELNVQLDVDDAAIDYLAERGYSAEYGGRKLRRTLEDELVVPVAELLAKAGADARDGAVSCVGTDVGLRFQLAPSSAQKNASTTTYQRAAQLRRAVEYWYHLDRIVELKDRVSFLVAEINQLGRARKPAAKRRAAIELPALTFEHKRIAKLAEDLSAARESLGDVEEVALGAHLVGEDAEELLPEAEAAYDDFRRVLPYALVGMHAVRDAATFVVQQPDKGVGLRRWLVPLLRYASKRKWQINVHVPRDIAQPGLADWYEGGYWGPPQTSEWVTELIERQGSTLRDVLLRVRGPSAGAFLAVETGLHRIDHEEGKRPDHLLITLCRMNAEFAEADVGNVLLRPRTVEPRNVLSKMPAVRQAQFQSPTLSILFGERTLTLDAPYWECFDRIVTEHLLVLISNSWEIKPEEPTAETSSGDEK